VHDDHIGPAPRGAARLGSELFLAVFAVVTFYPAIASLHTNPVQIVSLWLIFVGLALLSLGAGASMANVTKGGGWVILTFAVLAWHHAAGEVIAATFGRELLPMVRRRSGRQVTGGRFVGELEQDRGHVIAMARLPQVTQVGRRAYGASAVQATQVPRYRRAQVQMVKQAERDEPGGEIGFQGPGFLPGRR
jgi:hypothetical protein